MSNTTTTSKANKKNKKTEAIETQLHKWAHEGTRESVDSLIDFISREKDEKLKAYAQIAYEEASFFYYAPNTDSEEADFLIAKMIQKREANCDDLMYKIEAGELELQRLKIDKKVTQKLRKTKKINEECVYMYCEDFARLTAGRLEELKEELQYENNWINAARTFIKSKKFLTIPYDVLSHIHLDADNDISWMNDFMKPEEDEIV